MLDPLSTLASELVGNIKDRHVLAKHCGCLSALVAQGLHHLAVKYSKGQFKILSDNTAVEVMGACKLDNNHFLLCQELTKEKEIAKGFFVLENTSRNKHLLLTSTRKKSMCDAAAFSHVHCKDNAKKCVVAARLKKTRYFEPNPKMKKHMEKYQSYNRT